MLVGFIALVFVTPPMWGMQVTLSPFISDHMVVQRDEPFTLWGTADSLAQVFVERGEEKLTTRADSEGAWSLELASRPASTTPFAVTIRSGSQTVQLSDMLTGDVWVCAGQSNMEFPLSRDQDRSLAVAVPEELRIYSAHYPKAGPGGSWSSTAIQRLDPGSFLQGTWSRCSPEPLSGFSAVAFYFGQALSKELQIPIGLVSLAAGGTPTESWISKRALAMNRETRGLINGGDWLKNPLLEKWCQDRARLNFKGALAAGAMIPEDPSGPHHPFKPGFMAQATVAPLTRSAVRGIIWYQGESNAESAARVNQHRVLFPLLIRDLRKQWNQPELPFLFVQLPAMGRPHWPRFREQQRRFSESLSHVGMAVTIDVGHPTDVHPRKKRPVGIRLALLALHGVYGSDRMPTGPTIKSFERTEEGIQLLFANTGGGLATRDESPPRGFEVVGSDGMIHPVSARLQGNTVLLLISPTVKPMEVRYAWAPVPDCNLTDREGLPASPFSIR